MRNRVRADYARIALGTAGQTVDPDARSCCHRSNDPDRAREVAEALGYQPSELETLPEGANLGLSCGNPTAIAQLTPGQVVLDLGSGAGFDCFLAGPQVGAAGRVIGVDMTAEMLTRARENLEPYRARTGFDNVEFRLGEIEHLPVADGCVDVVISNCVINLSTDKPQVWREVARVLRPGGVVAASDMALQKPLPLEAQRVLGAWSGCIAGAIEIEAYRQMVGDSGLVEVVIEPKPEHGASLDDCEDPLYRRLSEMLPPSARLSDFVASVTVTARKPS